MIEINLSINKKMFYILIANMFVKADQNETNSLKYKNNNNLQNICFIELTYVSLK